MDDLWALDGGAASTRWRKKRAKRKEDQKRLRKRRAAQDAREYRWDKEQLRKRRVKRGELRDPITLRREARRRRKKLREQIEKDERKAFLKRRKAEGYKNPKLPYKNIVGKRYGRLVVIAPAGHNPSGSKRWWVQCDCGSPIKEVAGTNLKQRILSSCGCLRGEGWRIAGRRRRHAAAKKIRKQLRSVLPKWRRSFCRDKGDARLLLQLREFLAWGEAQIALAEKEKRPYRYNGRYREALR